ncbi:MAG TPA: VWA domain-containing protein [Verrucomicrobiota bacterium]|nr:VWA domain-containing protein [Verrucomicrobiota bacterium]HNU51136.1 VWA domain-containing protein [Verrucomicrobiota bacterium]
MIASLRWASPWWLPALLLPALWMLWRLRRPRRPAALAYTSASLLSAAAQVRSGGPRRWLEVLWMIALSLLVLALARPQTETAETREDARGINIMLALDFSGTMKTRDFFLDGRRVSRSEGLKRISAEFIRGRPNDRIGLVSFDRDAWLSSPLTLDHDWLLERLKLETNGVGTAVGSGLLVSVEHLQQHSNETRVVILMTDAENISAGPAPTAIAEALHPLGVRIHCIQILSPGQPAPVSDLSELFTRMTARTGGEFFRVRSGTDLRAVYAAIDRLEKQKLTDRREKAWRELFPWLAVPALGLLLTAEVLAYTRWRRLP